MIIQYDAIDWVADAQGRGRPRVRRSGEVWGPGPVDSTVWVLDPERRGLGARVVHLKTRREVEDVNTLRSAAQQQEPTETATDTAQFELFSFS